VPTPDKRIELGSDHWMQWFVPYAEPEVLSGVIVWHPARPEDTRCAEQHDGWCGGAVPFDIPANQGWDRDKWRVLSLDPLTLSPSLACHCGDHGFIVGGRWSLEAAGGSRCA
jgi:hypothetical protein